MASPTVGAPATSPAISAPIFQQDRFIARQQIFTFALQFFFLDSSGNTLAYLRQRVFTWREEIRIFTDHEQTMELLSIKPRKIMDWGTAFDVTDSINRQKVGGLKRRGWKSLGRKEWAIMDANDQEIGKVQEDSLLLATVRRYLTNIIPQSYSFEIAEQLVGTARQNWNFLAPKMDVDFTDDPRKRLDRRLLTAAIVLLMAVEGRQSVYD